MSTVATSITVFEAQRAAESRRSASLDPAKMLGLKTLLASCVQDFSDLIAGRRTVGWANNFQAVDLGVHNVANEARIVLAEPSIYHATSPKTGKVYEIDEAAGMPALVGLRFDLVAVTKDVELASYDYELYGSPGSLFVARHEVKHVSQLYDQIEAGKASQGTFEDVEGFSEILSEIRAAESAIAS